MFLFLFLSFFSSSSYLINNCRRGCIGVFELDIAKMENSCKYFENLVLFLFVESQQKKCSLERMEEKKKGRKKDQKKNKDRKTLCMLSFFLLFSFILFYFLFYFFLFFFILFFYYYFHTSKLLCKLYSLLGSDFATSCVIQIPKLIPQAVQL